MNRFALIGLSFACVFPQNADARVWCENTDKTGYWADKCPANMVTAEQANEWKPAPVPVHERPRVGMTSDEVLALAWPWGKPEKVNTTTTAHAVREQWVYGAGRYLYFIDGVLTSIQE